MAGGGFRPGGRLGTVRGKFHSDGGPGSPGMGSPPTSGRLPPVQEGVQYDGAMQHAMSGDASDADEVEMERPMRRRQGGNGVESPGQSRAPRLQPHPADRQLDGQRHSTTSSDEKRHSSGSQGDNSVRYRRMMLRPGENESSKPISMSRLHADPSGIGDPGTAAGQASMEDDGTNESIQPIPMPRDDDRDQRVVSFDREQPRHVRGMQGSGSSFELGAKEGWPGSNRMSSAMSEVSLQSSVLPRKKARFGRSEDPDVEH